MIKYTLISANTTNPTNLVKDSLGRYFVFYLQSFPSSQIVMAYSADDGDTWTEVTASVPSGFTGSPRPMIVIDSDDIIHIVYARSSYIFSYNIFNCSSLTFGTAEDIFDGTSNTDSMGEFFIAIDSNDIPHVAWAQERPGTSASSIYYSNRNGGSWAARTDLTTGTDTFESPKMVIDSQDYISIVAMESTGTDSLNFFRYTGSWAVMQNLNVSLSAIFGLVVDSSDNLICIYYQLTGTQRAKYIFYNRSLEQWDSTGTTLNPEAESEIEGIGINRDDKVFVLCRNIDYFSFINGESSKEPSRLRDLSGSNFAIMHTPFYPQIDGISTQKIIGEDFAFILADNTNSETRFMSTENKNYGSADSSSLPSDAGFNLDYIFTEQDDEDVAFNDLIYVDRSATDEYAVFYFVNRGTDDTNDINITWIGKSSLAPSSSPVVLQILNWTGAWETVATESSAAANTPFTMSASITSNPSNYYDDQFWVYCRVYQLAQ